MAEEQTIYRMDDILASQVAAGEVVERPASVIKELVENSIDAGATTIRVEIHRGGIAGIKVTDNGKGMSRADLALCMQRHATSKLREYDDLYNINQMGFRGEALPSIASVAHVRIATRRAQDIEGALLESHGGEETPIIATGCPPGTQIEVQQLFYNTPVRRKFLKSADTEAGHVEHQLKLHALAFPDIRFTFLRDGQEIFDVPATHDLRRRISDFAGRDTAERLLRIRPAISTGVRVEGYLMPLTEARRNRRMQYVFLNGRPIEDKIISRAVRDGYGGFPTGLHPGLYLYLTIEPALVDVNVHPAKREVRFRRPADVTLAIIDAISGTLSDYARGETPQPQAAPPLPEPLPAVEPPPARPNPAPHKPAPPTAAPLQAPTAAPRQTARPSAAAAPAPSVAKAGLRLSLPPTQQELELTPRELTPPAAAAAAASGVERFRFLGNLRNNLAVFESQEGLMVLSLRAARERVIFERLMRVNERPVHAQHLLIPTIIELDERDMGLAQELKPLLMQAGFSVSAFGHRTLRIETIPSILPDAKVEEIVLGLIATYSSGEMRMKRDKNPYRPFAIHLARQQVKQEDMNTWQENPLSLLDDLLRCENPYCTARGKPTMIPYPYSEILRKFQAQ